MFHPLRLDTNWVKLNQCRYCFKSKVGKILERWSEAPMGFFKHYHATFSRNQHQFKQCRNLSGISHDSCLVYFLCCSTGTDIMFCFKQSAWNTRYMYTFLFVHGIQGTCNDVHIPVCAGNTRYMYTFLFVQEIQGTCNDVYIPVCAWNTRYMYTFLSMHEIQGTCTHSCLCMKYITRYMYTFLSICVTL